MKMENYEIQEMKDDLYNLSYELEGCRDGNTIRKALEYINELEDKLCEIASDKDRAKRLLENADYLVIKPTASQLRDSARCEELSEQGEDMDCEFCSCSCCLIQQ